MSSTAGTAHFLQWQHKPQMMCSCSSLRCKLCDQRWLNVFAVWNEMSKKLPGSTLSNAVSTAVKVFLYRARWSLCSQMALPLTDHAGMNVLPTRFGKWMRILFESVEESPPPPKL